MDKATFDEVNIESSFGDDVVWISANDLVRHLNSVAWDTHDRGYLADAAVITEIGKWLESCMVNAMIETILDIRDTEGPEAAAEILVNLINKA